MDHFILLYYSINSMRYSHTANSVLSVLYCIGYNCYTQKKNIERVYLYLHSAIGAYIQVLCSKLNYVSVQKHTHIIYIIR